MINTNSLELKDLNLLKKKTNSYISSNINNPNKIVPTGSITITKNGKQNIKKYASANVRVPNPSKGTYNITYNTYDSPFDIKEFKYANIQVPNPSTGHKTFISNGTYDVTQYAYADVCIIKPWPNVPVKDVNLYDFDGKRLYSYTAEEFLELEALPTEVPKHRWLENGEWNINLSKAKEIVTQTGYLMIGRYRQPLHNDEDSYLLVHITENTLNLSLYFDEINLTVGGGIRINWGDGIEILQNVAGTVSHTYDTIGDYIIRISSRIGQGSIMTEYTIGDSSEFRSIVGVKYDPITGTISSETEKYTHTLRAFYGDGLCKIGDFAFYGCRALKEISFEDFKMNLAKNAINYDFHYLDNDFSIPIKIPTIVFPYGGIIESKNICRCILSHTRYGNVDTYFGEYIDANNKIDCDSIFCDDNGVWVVPEIYNNDYSKISQSMISINMTDVFILGNHVLEIDSGIDPYNVIFHVPNEILDQYQADANWQNFTVVGM